MRTWGQAGEGAAGLPRVTPRPPSPGDSQDASAEGAAPGSAADRRVHAGRYHHLRAARAGAGRAAGGCHERGGGRHAPGQGDEEVRCQRRTQAPAPPFLPPWPLPWTLQPAGCWRHCLRSGAIEGTGPDHTTGCGPLPRPQAPGEWQVELGQESCRVPGPLTAGFGSLVCPRRDPQAGRATSLGPEQGHGAFGEAGLYCPQHSQGSPPCRAGAPAFHPPGGEAEAPFSAVPASWEAGGRAIWICICKAAPCTQPPTHSPHSRPRLPSLVVCPLPAAWPPPASWPSASHSLSDPGPSTVRRIGPSPFLHLLPLLLKRE